jgi:DNA-binding response OmpR family regulator
MNAILEATDEKTSAVSYRQGAQGLGRILMVDDDASMRFLVCHVLSHAGYEADQAENGAQAWRALQLKHYDLVITDQDMPELTGLQLVHRIRMAGFELPVILASGRATSDLLTDDWLGLTATILPKPFTLDELTRTVGGLLPDTSLGFNTHSWQAPPNQVFQQK